MYKVKCKQRKYDFMNVSSRHFGLVIKTFLYQIVMSLFGFMMYLATYKIPYLLIVGQGMVILFFLFIMASQSYNAGAKNCEYDRAHGMKSSPALGILLSLLAFLPTMVLAVVSVINPPYATPDSTNTLGYFSYLGNHAFLQGMYVGITQALFPTAAGTVAEGIAEANSAAINSRCLVHLLGFLPGFLTSSIAYFIGYLSFKKTKKQK